MNPRSQTYSAAPIPNNYNSIQHGNFLSRERMPGVLLIMAFWKRIKSAVSWSETTSAVIFMTAFLLFLSII